MIFVTSSVVEEAASRIQAVPNIATWELCGDIAREFNLGRTSCPSVRLIFVRLC